MKKNYNFFSVIFRELKICSTVYWYIPFLLIIYAFVNGALPLVGIFLPRLIIDAFNESNKNYIINTIIILCAIGFILGTLKYLIKGLFDSSFIDVRLKEFTRVNQLSLKIDYKYMEDASFRNYFETAISALDGDGMGFQAVLTEISIMLPQIVTIVALSIIVGLFNYIVVLSCLVSAVIVSFANSYLAKYIASKRSSRAKAMRQKNYFTGVSYDFNYGKDIRVYGLQDKLSSDFEKKGKLLFKITKDIENKRFLFGLLEILGLIIQDAFAYYFIIKSYFDGAISLGEVSLYISAIILLSVTFREFTLQFSDFIKNEKYVESYLEFIDNKTFYTERGNKKALPNGEQLEIEFKNVTFRYPHTDFDVLKDFNFKINKGEKLAIVGTNGAGKSTIVKLLTGLFLVDKGEILINGTNIQEFDKDELSKMFSVVYQDINIYPASVIENIVGDDTSLESRVKAISCIEHVGLKDKIESLPLKYDTILSKVIDDNGVDLSGGQKQKICIARALYKDGNMVILDEPTAALDALAEASIYQGFDDLVKNKTAIYISHRLSSTKFCDKIALFSKEGLKEYGTHEELMNLKGIYYEMFNTQGKYYKEGVNENA